MKFSEIKNLPDQFGIYKIKNLNTNKVYIGSCTSFIGRMKRHYYYLKHNKHHSVKLQNSWNKHGEDFFDIEIVETFLEISKFELKNLEEKYIKEFDSFKNGYNMTDICYEYSTFKQSEEAIEKFRKSRFKSVVAIDRFTGEYIDTFESITSAAKEFDTSTTNISGVCKGRLNYIKDVVFVYSNEYDSTKNYKYDSHHMKGVPKSEEQKEKMGKFSKKSIPIYKYDSNGNLIEEFYSISDCERKEGFKKDTLRYKLDKVLDSKFLYTKNKKLKI